MPPQHTTLLHHRPNFAALSKTTAMECIDRRNSSTNIPWVKDVVYVVPSGNMFPKTVAAHSCPYHQENLYGTDGATAALGPL